jgi:hypothetical protein
LILDTAAAGGSGLTQADVRTAIGMASANLDTQLAGLATAANLATVAGYLDTEIAAILADTNELQTDWANDGRLDSLLDAVVSNLEIVQTDTNQANVSLSALLSTSGDITSIMGTALNETSPGYLAAAFEFFFDVASPAKTVNDVGVAGSGLTQADVRTAIGMASANLDTQLAGLATAANLATVAGYLDTEIAAILADTNELQTDWANGGRLDLILDTAAAGGSGLTQADVRTAIGMAAADLDTQLDAILAGGGGGGGSGSATGTVADVMGGPLSASGDGISFVGHSLPDLIAAEKHEAAKIAGREKQKGIRFNKFVPNGSISRDSSED